MSTTVSPLAPKTVPDMPEIAGVRLATAQAGIRYANRTDVLRVWITASPETRARRLAEAQSITEAEAERAVARGDANRADYLKRFYGASTELPTHYDIVINTDHVAAEDGAGLILSAARAQQVPA